MEFIIAGIALSWVFGAFTSETFGGKPQQQKKKPGIKITVETSEDVQVETREGRKY